MTEERKNSLFRQKLELLILTQSEDVLARAKVAISNHFITFRTVKFEDIQKGHLGDLLKAQLILLAQEEAESLSSFESRVNEVLRLFPRSRVVTVMGPKENLEGAQNPRVSPLSSFEFFSTLKFEYICLYRCRSQYYQIQSSDLFSMTTITFPTFIQLPLNQRYLAVAHSNTVLSDERFQRMAAAEGLFIKAKDSDMYFQYISNYFDMSGAGLKKRARGLFLNLCYYSCYLNEGLLFDFASKSEGHCASVYEKIKKLAEELFQVLRTEESLWDVFRETLDDDFSLFWRAPWIATYATLIAVKSGQGDPMTTLLSGLLMDVGLYDLEEDVTRQYLLSKEKNIEEKMQKSFEKHPLLSLNRCLIKKVPMDEKVKSVLVCTHEKANEKGFPNQVPAAQLPVEAQLLMFAEKIDKGVLTTMKQTGVGFRFLKEKLWEAENTSLQNFSPEFLNAIADALI
ncbi:MAG: hypothetical protein KUL82_04785 [Bdellovibrio sp.]|nr:hypothetical protein [Bdellovibrio sp.]